MDVQASLRESLDRWVDAGLMSPDQGAAILQFEQRRDDQPASRDVGRLAGAISTVGAAIAIAAVVGIVSLFAQDWSAGQAMAAASIGAAVMIGSAWVLVRNGWGAPAGLCAFCGLALIPVAIGLGVEVAGWWPEDIPERTFQETERQQRRTVGLVLLASILPGMLTTRLGLRQAWTALPGALWFGSMLLVTNVFDNTGLAIVQVVVGGVIAGFAGFALARAERGRGTAWWLQLGGLLLFAQGVAFSALEDRALFWLLAVAAAAVVFIIGVVRDRTSWTVAGALPAVFPFGALIFEYFEGLSGLFILAAAGLAAAFLPLVLRRRG